LTGQPAIPVALSTSSVYPERTPDAFEMAARLGYDGLEVMVYTDPVSQSGDALARLVDYHQVPVLAVHTPSLLLTQLVWGREPWGKLLRAKELAERLGAKVVVLHPPFRWQRDYVRGFEQGLAKISEETDVIFAVENMFPIRAGTAEVSGYAPHWDPTGLDVPNVTLDLSHTAASASDAIVMANELGPRLAHVHLADGTGVSSGTVPDEHLVPGRGRQPCAELLRGIAATGYRGMVVAEVNTRRVQGRDERLADLAEALAFARNHLASVPAALPASRGAARAVWTEERGSVATERRGKTARKGGPETSGNKQSSQEARS
jgi:sugar phosphate isomerase/epimerase